MLPPELMVTSEGWPPAAVAVAICVEVWLLIVWAREVAANDSGAKAAATQRRFIQTTPLNRLEPSR
jgi:hypothetical protein